MISRLLNLALKSRKSKSRGQKLVLKAFKLGAKALEIAFRPK